MKKTKVLKIIIAILIAITLFTAFTQKVSASFNIDINALEAEKDKGNATNTAADLTGKVLNWIQVFGLGFALIMLVVIGIRWIGAAPSGKAQIAKTARYYVLGVVLIIAAIGLLQIVKSFTSGLRTEAGV